MTARLLADAVVLVHLLFIVFALAGGLLVLRRAWLAWVHLPAAGWAAAIELTGRVCPLTPLENALRRAAGEAGYAESFVAHYLLPVIYPPGLTRGVQWALALLVLAVNAAVYARVWQRKRGRTGKPS